MTTRRIHILAAATLAVAAAAAPAAAQQTAPGTQPADSAAVSPQARATSGGYAWTAADVHFMSAMIGHHAQAIQMSRMAPTHGASPTVQILAARIINAQQDEIATMQQWLRDRAQPVPDAVAGPMKMTMNGMEHEMLMPGMLTPEQMAELDAARGTEFDRLFLTYMIRHHQGAVSMVHDLFATYGAGQDEMVFKFASDVNVDQTTEIARMQRMLAEVMFGQPVP